MLDEQVYIKMASDGRSKLLSFAKRNLHKSSAQDAPDIVQSALMQVWRHRHEDITNLRQYVHIAILQACMDRNKRIRRYVETFVSDNAAARRQLCHRSDPYTRAWITEILRLVPIADRQSWRDAFDTGSCRFTMPEGETQYYRNRMARQKVRIRKALSASA